VTRTSSPPGPGSLTATQRRLGRDWRLAALFLAPTAVLVGALVLVPIAQSIITSTTERHGQDSVFVGLGNYLALVSDEQFHTGVVNSFVFTAYAEVFKVVLGLSAALLLHHRRRGRALADRVADLGNAGVLGVVVRRRARGLNVEDG
jgi:multiple sugar transport system permease protein